MYFVIVDDCKAVIHFVIGFASLPIDKKYRHRCCTASVGVGWDLMAQEFAKTFYDSKAWKDCKRIFISERITEDGGLCQRCHELPGFIVHHKILLTPENIHDAEISLNTDNLEYVCNNCHNKIHLVERYGLNFCGFDSSGQPIQKR